MQNEELKYQNIVHEAIDYELESIVDFINQKQLKTPFRSITITFENAGIIFNPTFDQFIDLVNHTHPLFILLYFSNINIELDNSNHVLPEYIYYEEEIREPLVANFEVKMYSSYQGDDDSSALYSDTFSDPDEEFELKSDSDYD